MTLSHFVIQTKHGIIVEVSTVSSIRKNKVSKSNKKGLNPLYERNLEIIMMNMQNILHSFLNSVIIKNIDFTGLIFQ